MGAKEQFIELLEEEVVLVNNTRRAMPSRSTPLAPDNRGAHFNSLYPLLSIV